MTALRSLLLTATVTLTLAGCQPETTSPSTLPANTSANTSANASANADSIAQVTPISAPEPEFAHAASDEPITGGQAEAAAREAAGIEEPYTESESGPEPWFGEGQPVSITLEHVYTPGKPDYIMVIRSRADELTIYDLEINRGNCQHSHIQKVMVPVDMPFTLKFGQAKKVRVLCDKVIEASVDTQFGRVTLAE